jgi:hypothetical protein
MPGAEVADMLETYARLAPARTVLGVELPGLGWRVRTTAGHYRGAQVVVVAIAARAADPT